MPLTNADESLWLVGDTIGTFVNSDSTTIRYPNNNLIGLKTNEITKLLSDKKELDYPKIKDIIRNPPATIILWNDGTKTVVKCQKCDKYDFEKGLAMCFAKKMLGNKGKWYDTFKNAMAKLNVEVKK